MVLHVSQKLGSGPYYVILKCNFSKLRNLRFRVNLLRFETQGKAITALVHHRSGSDSCEASLDT